MENKPENKKQYTKKGFDDRIVRYEQIHKVKEKDYEALLGSIDPKEGDIIFEGCSGYADVSKRILDNSKNFKSKPEIYLLDESLVQLDRARQELEIPEDHITLGDIRSTGLPDGIFNKTIIKMGIHELPKDEQPKVFMEMHRILKPGGKFITWELSLNAKTQKAFQDILRKKDELAGFDAMVENRYFQRHDELKQMFKDAGYKEIKDEYNIRFIFDPKGRFEELISKDKQRLLREKRALTQEDETELKRLAQERVDALIAYIRERVTDDLKELVDYKDLGDNIEMTFDKVIMSGLK